GLATQRERPADSHDQQTGVGRRFTRLLQTLQAFDALSVALAWKVQRFQNRAQCFLRNFLLTSVRIYPVRHEAGSLCHPLQQLIHLGHGFPSSSSCAARLATVDQASITPSRSAFSTPSRLSWKTVSCVPSTPRAGVSSADRLQ